MNDGNLVLITPERLQELLQAETRVRQLHNALVRYGEHLRGCAVPRECTCGLWSILTDPPAVAALPDTKESL